MSLFDVNLMAIVFTAGTFIGLVLLWQAYRVVREGENWTVETLGRFSRVLTPGFNFIIPGIEKVGHVVSMKERFVDIPQQQVITKDNAPVTVDAIAFYQIFDASKAAYQIGGGAPSGRPQGEVAVRGVLANLEDSIRMLKITNLRAVVGSMDLDDVLSHRDAINDRLLAVVGEAVAPWVPESRGLKSKISPQEIWLARWKSK
jgi:regulator of protease activity HflC (stomatin/prohibitin superfamily)